MCPNANLDQRQRERSRAIRRSEGVPVIGGLALKIVRDGNLEILEFLDKKWHTPYWGTLELSAWGNRRSKSPDRHGRPRTFNQCFANETQPL